MYLPIEISNIGTGKVGDTCVIAKSAVDISVGCSGLKHQGRVRSAKLAGFHLSLGGGSLWSRAVGNDCFARAGPERNQIWSLFLRLVSSEFRVQLVIRISDPDPGSLYSYLSNKCDYQISVT